MPSDRIIKDPIYQQLNQHLRKRLSSRKYRIGDRFLTERQVCVEYNVSRTTANKALSNLVSEGLLEFKKGVGTFVQGQITQDEISALQSFTDNVRHAGMKPTTRVVRFEQIRASDAVEGGVIEKLKLNLREKIYFIERLRLADKVPMMLERRYLVAKYCPGLTKQMLEGSLYSLFERLFKLNVTGSDETIHAVTIKSKEAKLLCVPSGKAGFLISSVGYIEWVIPLWWESTLHRPDGFEFRCRVRPVQSERTLHQRVIVSRKLKHNR